MNFAVQTTDWRGLCEELLRELENYIAVHYISAADAVILVAQMGERFRRDHRQCQERAA